MGRNNSTKIIREHLNVKSEIDITESDTRCLVVATDPIYNFDFDCNERT